MRRTKTPDPPLTRGDRARAWLVGALALPIAFFVYCLGRAAFCESVGVTVGGLGAGLMILGMFTGFLLVPAMVVGFAMNRLRLGLAPIVLVCAAAVAIPVVSAARSDDTSWDEWSGWVDAVFSETSFLALGVILGATFCRATWHGVAHAGATFVVFAVVGIAVAEAELLIDESRFAGEVERNGVDRNYDRARIWPNGNCGLVYIAGKGTHATD